MDNQKQSIRDSVTEALKAEDENVRKALLRAASVHPSALEPEGVKDNDTRFIDVVKPVYDPDTFTAPVANDEFAVTPASIRGAPSSKLTGPSLMAGMLAAGMNFSQPIRPSQRKKLPGWKKPDTSATGSITKDERDRRNKIKKQAEKAKKKNRK